MSKTSLPLVATFVAAPGARFTAETAAPALASAGASAFQLDWLDPGVALDAFFEAGEAEIPALAARIEAMLRPHPIDVVLQPIAHRRKALLVADMDSTMIAEECLDELARSVGVGAQVAALTAKAMRGEVDFEAALETRVALFQGVAVETIDVLARRLTPNPGAHALVATMRAHGAHTALVSGGFTLFAAPVGAALGFDAVFANALELEAGRLTGRVTPPILGARAKAETLARLRDAHGAAPQATLAIGDGANDLEMLVGAGLGVAYRAKPVVAARARARLDHADLTALLYAQGFAREAFVTT